MAAEAVLFDLDGTIWDSWPFYIRILSGKTGTKEGEVRRRLLVGDNVVAMLRDTDLSAARFARECETEGKALKLYPSVEGTLPELRYQRIPFGVVTNLPGWVVKPMLLAVGLEAAFDVLRVFARKPSPAAIFRALQLLDVAASARVFYVGDSSSDADAIHRAGGSFVWAAYGYAEDPPAGADRIVRAFSEVLAL